MLKSNLDEREECDYRGCVICRQQGMKMGQEPVATWVDAHGLYMCDSHMQSHGVDKLLRETSAVEDRKRISRIRANNNRKAKDQAMRDCGLVKVRGALGGIYWE